MEKKSKATEHVEIQHAYIKKDLEILKNEIMKDVAPEDFREWKLAYMWQLRDFWNTLSKHFDYEEESGFMSEIINEAPENLKTATQLRHEHEDIVHNLDEIILEIKSMDQLDHIRMDNIRERLILFISTIHGHETAENELIQRVYCQEYGYPSS
jgi:hypothetical protein